MFNEFKPVSKSEWLDKVVKDLKGRKPLEDFNWQYDGLEITPFYHRDDATESLPNLSTKTGNKWEIGTIVLVKDPKTANQQALAALEAGAESICFIFESIPELITLSQTLEGIQHEWIVTHFRAPEGAYPALVDQFLEVLQSKKQVPAKVRCSFASIASNPVLSAELLARQSELPLASFQTIKVGRSNVVNDLAQALVALNQCLNGLVDHNFDRNASLLIQCLISLEDNYFPFLAKVRALKFLTLQLGKAWGLTNVSFKILAELDAATLTEDVNYNRIKMTSQAMSAVTAGIDGLFLSTSTIEESDFSRRIALNIQHLLQQESFMDRVADPAAGSFFIDHLTKKIGEEAWSLFQQINAQS